VSFKNRIGTFFILIGALLLFVFVTSVFTPEHNYEVTALIAGGLLFVLGWQWRLAKSKGGPPASQPPAAPAAAKQAGPPPGAKPAGAAPKTKKPGPLAMILKGPPQKKTAPPPAPGVPAASGKGKKKK
jgi:hypothetical protein